MTILKFQSLFEVVNANGGIGGRMIRTVVEDDRYEPDPAVLNTQDPITRQHVFFLFDYVGTPTPLSLVCCRF